MSVGRAARKASKGDWRHGFGVDYESLLSLFLCCLSYPSCPFPLILLPNPTTRAAERRDEHSKQNCYPYCIAARSSAEGASLLLFTYHCAHIHFRITDRPLLLCHPYINHSFAPPHSTQTPPPKERNREAATERSIDRARLLERVLEAAEEALGGAHALVELLLGLVRGGVRLLLLLGKLGLSW